MSEPDLCYAVVLGAAPGFRISVVRRGDKGHFPTDYDDGTLPTLASERAPDDQWSIEEYVDELNLRLGVSKEQAQRMLIRSMVGSATVVQDNDETSKAR